MEPILDALTRAPAAQLFELDPPRYTSSFGKKTEAIFKNNVPPAPMLLSPDNGLILYERVISTRAEHQLLDKLTKPKFYHHIPTARKKENWKGGQAHASSFVYPSSLTHATPPSAANGAASPGPASRPISASADPHPPPRRPTSGRIQPLVGPPAEETEDERLARVHGEGAGAGAVAAAAAAATAAGALPGVGEGRGRGLQQRTRSASPGRPGGGGGGAGPGPGSESAQRLVRRKPLYPEQGPLKDYFSKERASVTATNVFTWGNRYKIGDSGTGAGRITGAGGGGGGGSAGRGRGGGSASDPVAFSSYMPASHKPPLRL
ncbi:hypothetical protein HYH03_015200 [Edaphochlamys debaryana]|uniref:Uncharacterized protein n=1 Tax=Edaphochlamys debaryana TaxID=47281 RepID=A0A835XMD6_9CHLO|nr:hypothetical protein HYH03_015200 [Edaphochlamys debaryana]|eukprot:KAG2486105.1 hypothetical protein HYH03_015200 [Edaphochlamys debaryana]